MYVETGKLSWNKNKKKIRNLSKLGQSCLLGDFYVISIFTQVFLIKMLKIYNPMSVNIKQKNLFFSPCFVVSLLYWMTKHYGQRYPRENPQP